MYKTLISINIFNTIFAFVTSLVQTGRINKITKKYNFKNTLFLIFLAIFAAATSIFQSNVIIRKTRLTDKNGGS